MIRAVKEVQEKAAKDVGKVIEEVNRSMLLAMCVISSSMEAHIMSL